MKNSIHILHVGKGSSPWYTLADTYSKRMMHSWNILITSIKDAPSTYSIEERKRLETKKILSTISKDIIPIELHPDGKQYPSHTFAHILQQWTENRTKIPTFLIAGTFGFTRELLPKERSVLSLSPMTFTHEMTLTILLEQLYRAYTILHNIQYHY